MRNFLSTFLGCIWVLSSCTPSTNITASWTNPEIEELNYNNVLVTAMTENVNAKEIIESELAEELRGQGVNVTKSIDLFPPNLRDEKMGSKEDLLQAIETNGFDAILTVNLIDKETDTRYIPGSQAYSPINRFGYYGNFWGYYNYWHPQVYDPGYYTEDKIYFFETNLYEAGTEKLVWSAQSETVNPNSIQSFSDDFARITVDSMTDQNLLSASTSGSN